MIKRLLAAASFFLLAIPSLAAAQGVTSSADPRATEAGREILHQGGSAADAAVAMVAVLTLVEPQSSGIGGGGFMVYHNAGDGSISTIDGRELICPTITSGVGNCGVAKGDVIRAFTDAVALRDDDEYPDARVRALRGGQREGGAPPRLRHPDPATARVRVA